MNQTTLRLLLVSGKRHDFIFSTSDTIGAVKKHVFENWPSEWDDERVQSLVQLRIVNKGRFLDDYVTLESEKLTPGTTTVMHLVPRPSDKPIQEEPQAEKPKESASSSSDCCCTIF